MNKKKPKKKKHSLYAEKSVPLVRFEVVRVFSRVPYCYGNIFTYSMQNGKFN